jgi:hypothetical protein
MGVGTEIRSTQPAPVSILIEHRTPAPASPKEPRFIVLSREKAGRPPSAGSSGGADDGSVLRGKATMCRSWRVGPDLTWMSERSYADP